MSLTLSSLIAKGMTDYKYNFEYLMNRAYAFKRDKGQCKVCGEPIIGHELETHHIKPKLPTNLVNKVSIMFFVFFGFHGMGQGYGQGGE